MGWSRSRDGGRTQCLGTTGPFSTQTPLARMKDAARGARPTHTSLSPRWKSDFVAGIVAQPASASTAAVSYFQPIVFGESPIYNWGRWDRFDCKIKTIDVIALYIIAIKSSVG